MGPQLGHRVHHLLWPHENGADAGLSPVQRVRRLGQSRHLDPAVGRAAERVHQAVSGPHFARQFGQVFPGWVVDRFGWHGGMRHHLGHSHEQAVYGVYRAGIAGDVCSVPSVGSADGRWTERWQCGFVRSGEEAAGVASGQNTLEGTRGKVYCV
uniref:(northern house mosquito) hypothetical protein n=1 Tax=Culex pipiens TaxID=7175 RepID=A0A8D8BZM3_CULPI